MSHRGGRLDGRVAIVTGAGQGIGEATARLFAAEGARVCVAEVVGDRGEAVAESLREDGHDALAVTTDVADPASVEAMVSACAQQLGAPDVLVNNAGIAVFDDPLQLTDEEWRRCFSVDLDGVWYGCRAVLPHMLDAGRGAIVNIGSVHSFQIIPHTFPYPVAKHGVIGVTRALAVEYASRGVRVNAICPGYIDTPVNHAQWDATDDPAAARQRAADFQPLGRLGQPEEIGRVALFLASEDASFVTGASLMADGGRSIVFHT